MKNKIITFPEDIIFVSSKIAGGRSIFYPSSFDLNMIKRLEDHGNVYAKEVFQSLKWFRHKNFIKLFYFCLMPNHLHFICKLIGSYNLNKFLKEFHKFTAHQILNLAEKLEDYDLLNYFAQKNFKEDRKHLIWADCVSRVLHSHRYLNHAINYVHNNPIAKGWNLVADVVDYPYSSACYYYNYEIPLIEVDDFGEAEL